MKNIANYLVFGISLGILLNLFGCSPSENEGTDKPKSPSVKLVLQWESDTTMTTCESVLYHPESGLIYVANINEGPWEKDGNGFISKLDQEGKTVDLKWVEGLNAPKGMGISEGKLYVNDVDELVEIVLESGEISQRYPVEGNPQLNDISLGNEGEIYLSGSGSNKIYQFKMER